MKDKWGREITEDEARALLQWEKPGQRRRPGVTEPKGYAREPGTGPSGETCGTCKYLYRNEQVKTYFKCELMSRYWTGGAKTDVRFRSPACSEWVARPAPEDGPR